MKKLKVILMSVAIIGAMTGAFATGPKFACENAQQYRFTGTQYVLITGQFGVNYGCNLLESTTCTYVFNGQQFVPCRLGEYFQLQ